MSKKLAVNVTVGGDTYAAGTEVPADVAKQITNPKAWGEGSADADVTAYADMKVPDLKAEIESRNESRDGEDQLSTSGNKAELVELLNADDARS